MTTVPLRVSPSGPIIKNEKGGPLAFGKGATLRKDSGNMGGSATPDLPPSTTIELSSNVDGNTYDFRAMLEDVSSAYDYVARISCDFFGTSALDTPISIGVSLYANTSADDSGSELFLNQCTVPLGNVDASGIEQTAMHCDFQSNPFDPSNLPGWKEGDPIWVLAKVNAGAVPNNSILFWSPGQLGSARIELCEQF